VVETVRRDFFYVPAFRQHLAPYYIIVNCAKMIFLTYGRRIIFLILLREKKMFERK